MSEMRGATPSGPSDGGNGLLDALVSLEQNPGRGSLVTEGLLRGRDYGRFSINRTVSCSLWTNSAGRFVCCGSTMVRGDACVGATFPGKALHTCSGKALHTCRHPFFRTRLAPTNAWREDFDYLIERIMEQAAALYADWPVAA
jgi:hypothetical protein